MTIEEFEEIFENTESELSKVDGDNCFLGLQILSKYTKNLVHGAEHDRIFSESIENLIDASITKEDVISLAKLNWSIEEECLYCFV